MVGVSNYHGTQYNLSVLEYLRAMCIIRFSILLITGAIAIHNSFSETILPVYIYDLNCTGIENTFQNCPHNALNPNLCNYRQDAAVSCLPIESWCNY